MTDHDEGRTHIAYGDPESFYEAIIEDENMVMFYAEEVCRQAFVRDDVIMRYMYRRMVDHVRRVGNHMRGLKEKKAQNDRWWEKNGARYAVPVARQVGEKIERAPT